MTAFRLGITGSIGMGKSTTAAMFAAEGIPVWDADAMVHRLYAPKGEAAVELARSLPEAMDADGAVSRNKLRDMIRSNPAVLEHLTSVVHPLVAADRAAFIARTTADIILLDIPLLFETKAETQCDAVLVVTAPESLQKARVLDRGGMTPEDLALILARQMPDREKRARADHIVETLTIESARVYVRALIAHIRENLSHA